VAVEAHDVEVQVDRLALLQLLAHVFGQHVPQAGRTESDAQRFVIHGGHCKVVPECLQFVIGLRPRPDVLQRSTRRTDCMQERKVGTFQYFYHVGLLSRTAMFLPVDSDSITASHDMPGCDHVLGRTIGKSTPDAVAAGTAARLHLHDTACNLFAQLRIHTCRLHIRW
jgi:hypothetical protein